MGSNLFGALLCALAQGNQSMPMTYGVPTRRRELRIRLRALPEKQRRDLTHALLENSIGAASGCYTLVDMLLMVCPVEVLSDYIDMYASGALA
jgi:hypothetical protein